MSASFIPTTKAQLDAMSPEEYQAMMRLLIRQFHDDWENGWRPSKDSEDDLESNK
jgi:hypothetical protein